jgi:hypothetical protein
MIQAKKTIISQIASQNEKLDASIRHSFRCVVEPVVEIMLR